MKKEYDLKKMKRRPGPVRVYPEANKLSRTIRFDLMVIDQIMREADRIAIPYQTLINSILHRYVTGQLIDKPKEK